MFRFKFAGLTALAVATLLAVPIWFTRSTGAEAPAPPNRFYGEVFIDGDPAPEGTLILATIGGRQCGRTWVRADSSYVIDVVSRDQLYGCGSAEGESPIRLWVALESGTRLLAGIGVWSSGAFTNLTLWAQQGCLFIDDHDRGTKFSIVGSNWRFWGDRVNLTGSGGLTWDRYHVYVHARSGEVMVAGSGTCPSGPATINALHVSPLPPKNRHLVDESSGGLAPWFVPLTPTPTATPVGPTPTPTPPPEGYEAIPLATGCNLVTSTHPDGTAMETIADAVSPEGILVSIWRLKPLVNPVLNSWLAYSPEAVQFSNLTQVNLFDTFFICLRSPGDFLRPILD